MPDPNTERQILYITGASGSGKSTYTARYTKLYKQIFKNNPVFVFSALKDDESLDVIKPKRIKISKETLLDDPILIEDLKDSLCIFDDIDVISDKDLKNEVYNILNQILETGRHFKISCIITNHLPSNGTYTRRILNECHSVTYFPHSGNNGKIKKFLLDQIGLDKQDFINNKKAKSRWATIFKNYPMVNMTQKEIRLMDDEDDEKTKKINIYLLLNDLLFHQKYFYCLF
jgi:adenylate kinase family enzyme